MTTASEIRAFVAGATGYTGQAVVSELQARKATCFAHVRPDSPTLNEWRTKFQSLGATCDTTPWDEAAMTATLRTNRVTHVFALLGTTRARGGSYEAVDYGLTSLLLRACIASEQKPRFIYLSAVGVTPNASNPYYKARARLEAELLASPLDYVIARPSFITGSDRDETRPLERFAATGLDAATAVLSLFGAKQVAAKYRSNDAHGLAHALVSHAVSPKSSRYIAEGQDLHI